MATLIQHWRPTRLAARLITVSVVGLATTAIAGRPTLVVVIAPCLLALAWGGYRGRSRWLKVDGAESTERLYEGDEVSIELDFTTDAAGMADVVVHPELTGPIKTGWASTVIERAERHRMESWRVEINRWGHWTIGPWRVVLTAPGLMWRAEHRVSFPTVAVFPRPAHVQAVPLPPRLMARLGAHVSRRVGSGTEFAAVRPYAPGDSVRRVNWKVTQRRNGQPGASGFGTELYVNEFHAERMADVVAVVDTTLDIGQGETSSLDAAVRNAVAVTSAYLTFTDRVGVVGFGGFIRWLPPGAGTRHYYRVVETLMASRLDTSVLDPDLARLPRQALPSGALVYMFTPLLDPRVIESLRDLRERGHQVVVFDTLIAAPEPEKDEAGRAAIRLWEAERAALMSELSGIGIVVVDGGGDVLEPLSIVAASLRRVGDRS
jgi:uncharacterized protein (DUF58 family)